MKQIYLIALALTLLASCASEEVVDVNHSDSIYFRAAFSNGATTRGTDMTMNNLTKFYVTAVDAHGVLHFRNRLFEKEGEIYHLPDNEHLQWPEGTITFYAYAFTPIANMPASGNETTDQDIDNFQNALSTAIGAEKVEMSGSAQKITGFSPSTDIAKHTDLIVAKAKGSGHENSGGGVPLVFKHKLARIEVKAKATNHVYDFKIAGLKLGNIVSKGTLDLNSDNPASDWSIDKSSKTDYETDVTEITLKEEALPLTSSKGSIMLIPQPLSAWLPTKPDNKGAYLAVKLNITNKRIHTQIFPETGDYGWALIPLNTTWLPGNRYVYTLDFSEGAGYDEKGEPILQGPIYFTASITDWETAGGEIPMKTDAIPTLDSEE